MRRQNRIITFPLPLPEGSGRLSCASTWLNYRRINRNPVNWHFRMETPVNREMVVVQSPPMSLAVVQMETNTAELTEQIEKSFTAVYAAVNSGKIPHPGNNVIVYRQIGSGEVEVECGVQVSGGFEGAGEVVYRASPGGRVATTLHRGPYDRLGETHAALVAWSRSHGLRPTGIFWEVYGDWSDDPQQLRVEVFHQVAEDDIV
jgi:effector-binding domain-containing protein